MKKYLSAVLALLLTVSSFSCSDKKKDSKPESSNSQTVTENSATSQNAQDTSETENSTTSTSSVTSTTSAVSSSSTSNSNSKTTSTKQSSSTSTGGKTSASQNQNSPNQDTKSTPAVSPENAPVHEHSDTPNSPSGTFYDYDFTDIVVTPTVIDTESEKPFSENQFSVDMRDFGTLNSPCSQKEALYTVPGSPEYTDDFIEQVKNSQFPARVANSCYHDGVLYLALSYDINCTDSHCFKIFSYNISTGESEELYSYSNADSGVKIYYMYFAGDTLIANLSKTDTSDTAIEEYLSEEHDRPFSGKKISAETCRLDMDSHELVPIAEGECKVSDYDDRCITLYRFSYPDTDSDKRTASVLRYDKITEEISELKNITTDSSNDIFVSGETIFNTFKQDNRNIGVESDNFTLCTDIRGDLVSADKDKVTIVAQNQMMGNHSATLYVYDFKYMERYVLDLSDLAYNADPLGDNFIISQLSSLDYYLIPETGATFPVNNSSEYSDTNNYSAYEITEKDYSIIYISSNDGFSYPTYYDSDGKLCLAPSDLSEPLWTDFQIICP